MAIAHVCLECGRDLARVRPVREPHYNLRLVICPTCGRGWVRRRHPIQQAWRTFRRRRAAVTALIGQLFAIVVLMSYTIATSHRMADVMRGRSLEDLLVRYRAELAFAFVILPLVMGTWLGSAFPNWRRGGQWILWFALVAAFGWLMPLGYGWVTDVLLDTSRLAVYNWERSRLALLICAVIVAISPAAFPLARMVRRLFAHIRRGRWNKRRRKMRAWRLG